MNNRKATNFLVTLCISTTTFFILYELELTFKFKNSLLSPIANLSQNLDYEHKFKSLEEIHQFIKQQIQNLQEEGNCEEKKILLCRNVLNFYGFGSNVHRYGVCMQVAYGLGRMFFIQQDEYSHFDGVFQWVKPESSKCGYLKKKYSLDKSQTCNAQNPSCYLKNGYDINNTHRVIEFNTIRNTFPYPRHIPGTIPEELKENLLHLGIKSPWLWFTSQFLAYLLLRPNARFNATFSTMKKQINYTSPIVGLHIRHGDKITTGEAEYVNESIYVKNANDYFEKNNLTNKHIYIATDDIPAIKVVNKISPEFLTTSLPLSYLAIGLGNYFQNNFSKEIIESTLLDLYFLSNADSLVCDIASNLCRLAFELKQGLPPFKQRDVLKPVGKEKDFYYRWYDFVYPFSLWIASSNKLSSNLNDIIKSIRTVSTAENVYLEHKNGLYTKEETIKNSITEVWRIKKITNIVKHGSEYVFSGSGTIYVHKNDLLEWPGKPIYYFFK